VQQSKRRSATIQTAQCNNPNGTVQQSKRRSATIQTAQCNNPNGTVQQSKRHSATISLRDFMPIKTSLVIIMALIGSEF
jgi:hypothetical protein